MADLQRKHDTIRHIHHLQLPESLIGALDDASQAEAVVHSIRSLQHLTQQWNYIMHYAFFDKGRSEPSK